ncbi:hypothetical protein I4U23_003483 [Adineta vaga]|nr:hypothetical protein I4U23_003483 [Adineta vaga]
MITAIHKHVIRLRLERQNINDNDLKSVLTNICENFRRHGVVNNILTTQDSLKAMQFFCKHMIDSGVHQNILHAQIIDHELFILMENTLLSIVQKNNQITDQDWGPFHAMALLLTSSLPLNQFDDEKMNKIVKKTFFSEKFFNAIQECMENLLTNSDQNNQTRYRILSYVFRHIYVHSKTFKTKLQTLFLNLVLRCIISKLYIDQFGKNDEASQDFLLLDCPCFFLWNSTDRHNDMAKLLCQSLLKDYQTILSYRAHRKDSNPQKNEYLTFYLKLLNFCASIESIHNMFIQYLPTIITQLFTTMKDYLVLVDEKILTSIKDEELIASILTLLYNLMPNLSIRNATKENAPISTLTLLSGKEQLQITTNCERKKDIIPKNIQFEAQSLLALITDDIDQLDQPEEITRSSITCLAKAVKNESHTYEGVHASNVLANMNIIAQNDEVKEQIVEQGALRLLSDCVCDRTIATDQIRQPALHVIWRVSFNEKASSIWRTDDELINQLQDIHRSNKNEQQIAANAILWHLINEEIFRATQSRISRMLVLSNGQIQHPVHETANPSWVNIDSPSGRIIVLRENLTQEQNNILIAEREQIMKLQKETSQPYKYDLMISYSHVNADICTIIYNCLLKMGKYKIWFDKEEMHGSTLQRMAEAVEESHLMLVCMSSAYKSSKSCQMECEYAFKCHHNVLFLRVEANYIATGWLGIYLGVHLYIDVTKHDFLTTFKDIIKQISFKRNEPPDYSMIDKIVTSDVQIAFANALLTESKRESACIDTNIHHSVSLPTLSTVVTKPSHNSLNFDSLTTSNMKDTLNNEKKVIKESVTSETVAKYYPLHYTYSNVNDEQDSVNDIVVSIPTSSMLSLSNDDVGSDDQIDGFKSDLLSSMLPLMNKDTISVSELSLNTSRTSTPASPRILATSDVNQIKSVTEWTREDVLQFLKEKNLMHMSILFNNQEMNGKRLLELCKNDQPNDYERLKNELKKLSPFDF